MYLYLSKNQLLNEKQTDYQTLLLAQLYLLENQKLFRLALPRSKKRVNTDTVSIKLLCIPKKFEQAVLTSLHDRSGHASGEKLFELARLYIYLPRLYQSCFETANYCERCQQVKLNRRTQVPPMEKIPQFGPGRVFVIDFRVLARPTKEGHKLILGLIDSYSHWACLEPLIEGSAITTAKAIIRRILPYFPDVRGFCSDKGPQFISKLFAHLTKTLHWTHWSSSSLNPNSHGLVENLFGRFNRMIGLLAENDAEITECLPLIEMALNISVEKGLGLSPFQILRGYQPSLPITGMDMSEHDTPVKEPQDYIEWLKKRLVAIKKDVDKNTEQTHQQNKAAYDRRHGVTPEVDFQVGQKVWLLRGNPKGNSDQILTHKRFGQSPYYITKVVQRHSTFVPSDENPYPDLDNAPIGKAYQLTSVKDGRVLRFLVPARRLKKFYDKREYDEKHPPLTNHQRKTHESQLTDHQNKQRQTNDRERNETGIEQRPIDSAETDKSKHRQPKQGFEPAKRIMRQKRTAGQLQYLVQFADNSAYWCQSDGVSEALKSAYHIKQAALRRKRQKQSRHRFKQ
jgi:hypothetical protein